MKKIKLLLEYKCFPIWFYDENGELIDNDSPDELKSNNNIDDKLVQLQEKYDGLFLDDGIEFKYIGFKNNEEKNNFETLTNEIYLELKNIIIYEYEIENCIVLQWNNKMNYYG